MSIDNRKPTILVLGVTGQTGRLIVAELDHDPGGVQVRLAARRPEQVERLKAEGRDAVLLDLDDPRTFGQTLVGVDRLFLLTGYTVAMLVQSKTIVDAAAKAGVRHVVHQGIFGNWDCTDPHFAWHQLVERYIEGSGMAWTRLHPNVFMELLSNMMPVRDGAFPVFWGDRRVGWVAVRDIAAVAAAVLRDGPARHGGKDYWLSTEVASGPRSPRSSRRCWARMSAARSGSRTTSKRCSPRVRSRSSRGTPRGPSSSRGRCSTVAWATSARCGTTCRSSRGGPRRPCDSGPS
ncbi:MAG: SDR family oxidoreductase [Isosphaeraceae bacterium]